MNTTPPMVLVEWRDSSSTTGNVWKTVEEAIRVAKEETTPCVSVGFLVHEDAEWIVLVPHLSVFPPIEDSQGSGDMTIPRCSVIRIVTLAEAA